MIPPALILAGTHSGSGKTIATLAILAALKRRGLGVQGFKVGPDFIDPGYHAAITGRPGRNLDTWMLDPEMLSKVYRRGTIGAEIAVIEGVMGLFDGRSATDEAGSTADLARLWGLPVVLVVDAKGLARSIAPMVEGFARFDPRVEVVGAIANRSGSDRHYRSYLEPALSADSTVEPLGHLLRDERLTIPSRHLGLTTAEEFLPGSEFLSVLADAAEATIDLDRLAALARPPRLESEEIATSSPLRIEARIAIARDPAFCFYYEENLDLLRDSGAEIVPFSPLLDERVPADCGLVLLGGGYPEVFADRIAANGPMRASIRRHLVDGGALFAECGGLMACCESIRDRSGREFPMWGLIPASAVMRSRFAALGYVTLVNDRPTLLGPAGSSVRGHEFHYSNLEPIGPIPYAARLLRPDSADRPDGIAIGRLLANYAHIHLGSSPSAAGELARSAI